MDWTKKTAPNNKRGQPRRRVKPLWRQPTFIGCFLVCLAGGFGYVGWWIWQSEWIHRVVDHARSSLILNASIKGFVVNEILVEGRFETSRHDLLKALGLKRGISILAFDVDSARYRIEALPWVKRAVIQRQLPDVVRLFLWERRPMALWQRNGIFSLIDLKGEVIPLTDISAYTNLIVIVGKDAPQKASSLFSTLAQEPELASQVTAAVRVGERRWNIHLNDATKVLLPEDGSDAAWSRLAKLYKKYGSSLKKLGSIDLRLADRVVVRGRKIITSKGLIPETPGINFKSEDSSSRKPNGEMEPNSLGKLIKGRNT